MNAKTDVPAWKCLSPTAPRSPDYLDGYKAGERSGYDLGKSHAYEEALREGYVRGIERSCITLENFANGDGPSTAPLSGGMALIVEMCRGLVANNLNRVDRLLPGDSEGLICSEECKRDFERMEAYPFRWHMAREHGEQGRRLRWCAKQASIQAMMDEVCRVRDEATAAGDQSRSGDRDTNVVDLWEWVGHRAATHNKTEPANV